LQQGLRSLKDLASHHLLLGHVLLLGLLLPLRVEFQEDCQPQLL
jgi:hypothetical protein